MPSTGYTLSIVIPKSNLESFEIALEEIANAITITSSENSLSEEKIINLKVYLSDESIVKHASKIIEKTSLELGIFSCEIQKEKIPNTDWVAESQSNFSPFFVGSFYFYPTFEDEPLIFDRKIKINAGPAFGSGEHPTTQTCILALEYIENLSITPLQVLDVGTGSGILAIASTKIWSTPVFAIDNDPAAIKVARENAIINNSNNITFLLSDGVSSNALTNIAKFDLIVINILAGTIIKMSKGILSKLSTQGYIILSGFLNNQAEEILNTYIELGMTLIEKFTKEGWTTLILNQEQRVLERNYIG